MKKTIKTILLIILMVFSSNLLLAQTTIFEQSLQNPQSFNTFTNASVTGSQTWYFNTTFNVAYCNGRVGGINYANEDWLISPAINLLQTANVKLSFDHTRGYYVGNRPLPQEWCKVFATENYTGNPATTNWIELTGVNQNVLSANEFVSSGELIIPEIAKSQNLRIAFRYLSSASANDYWEIKNVKVTGEPQATSPNAGIFKITNWNTEWLGCTQFGPTDETLQINNVVAAILAMNSDIYCIQEVTNSTVTIANLITLLGSDKWDGRMAISSGDCLQRQGIIFKKSKVNYVNHIELNSGNAAQGNSYFSNWSSGRYPVLYNVNFISGNTTVPLSLVNIHAKATTSSDIPCDAVFTKRLGASQALKTILDGTSYNNQNLILIGDFNDYLVGTTCSSYVNSPYKNFVDDQINYNCVTQNITNFNLPIIENIIITNELNSNYITDSATRELGVSQSIANFSTTTSDHLPVSAKFQFSKLDNHQFDLSQNNNISIYPNPASDHITINCDNLASVTDWSVKITNMLGQEILSLPMNTTKCIVNLNSSASGGMCFVKIINAQNEVVNIKKIILQ
jgi:endonuclease/exonuclease/phosphatase family metal-dependent hydrolase